MTLAIKLVRVIMGRLISRFLVVFCLWLCVGGWVYLRVCVYRRVYEYRRVTGMDEQ